MLRFVFGCDSKMFSRRIQYNQHQCSNMGTRTLQKSQVLAQNSKSTLTKMCSKFENVFSNRKSPKKFQRFSEIRKGRPQTDSDPQCEYWFTLKFLTIKTVAWRFCLICSLPIIIGIIMVQLGNEALTNKMTCTYESRWRCRPVISKRRETET